LGPNWRVLTQYAYVGIRQAIRTRRAYSERTEPKIHTKYSVEINSALSNTATNTYSFYIL